LEFGISAFIPPLKSPPIFLQQKTRHGPIAFSCRPPHFLLRRKVSMVGMKPTVTASRMATIALALHVAVLSGCYSIRSSSGGGQTRFHPPRQAVPEHVALPPGYRIELVATHLTFPTGVAFDEQDGIYIVESGYSYGEVFTRARLLRLEPDGTRTAIASAGQRGPWNGVAWVDGALFVAEGGVLEGGRILRITPEGQITVLLDGIPSVGDHHLNGPAVGPDGKLYFGLGTASNSGVVGEDNAQFGWLARHPDFHDIPGQDIVLAGENFSSGNPFMPGRGRVSTGVFSPFGSPTRSGQLVRGEVLCSGGIIRISPKGGAPEQVAWGFRNPFGLGFSPEGELYVSDNGYDNRGSRRVWGAPDLLWRVRDGIWHGWPDFSGGVPLTHFKPPFKPEIKFVLASHPNPPPEPAARFGVHAAAAGLDFSRNPLFGYEGEAFVALFGDEAPITGKVLHPVGFKVVRVNTRTGMIQDFAVNRGPRNGPATFTGGAGLERPVTVRFNREGTALYVVDFGVMLHTAREARPYPETGMLWRITREDPL
jgi:glucose/arabinose dehydrogenase